MGNNTNITLGLPKENFLFRKTSLCFVLITSVFGNVLLLALLIRIRGFRLLVSKLVLNMTLCNLLLVIIWIPVDLHLLFNSSNKFPLASFGCKTLPAIATCCYTASIFTLVAIAFERWYAITRPFKAAMGKARVQSTFLWIYFVTFPCVYPVFHASSLATNGECYENMSLKYRQMYTLCLFGVQYIFPVLIMTFLYTMSWKKHFSSRKVFPRLEAGSSSVSEGNAKNSNYLMHRRLKQNFELLKTFTAIVVIFIITALPIQVLWILVDFTNHSWPMMLSDMISITKYANCVVNPWLYGRLNKNFRKDFKQLILNHRRT
ncbi:orexin receptor type 2-like [Hydractinia symbiolongicarpus]|uniref:orexin receptor type 2-like n=1 Tax=Hydractinia symbiolongicarpus TaxID=13093 RepID=UPI00254AC26B|nr:orexin receptor type 2-like [Hydractinia symbiolongicarpus]